MYDYNYYYYGIYIRAFLIIIVLIIILYFIFRKVRPSNISSHWHHPFNEFNISTVEFYTAIEEKLKKLALPQVYYRHVEYHEGSAFTPKRLYLHVYRFEFCFDICAAPFGKEFFISWWLSKNSGCSPIRGKQKPKTFYQLDTEIMFRETISNIVQETIEEFSQTKGFRSLTPEEKQVMSIPK
jgi:hypothetical protein